MKEFVRRHHHIVASSAIVVSFMVAAVYYVIVPSEASRVDGVARWMLLYGHSLCWILIGCASVLWFLRTSRLAISILVYLALGVYTTFMVVLFAVKG